MNPRKRQEWKEAATDTVFRAMASIYTGVFSIDLVQDSYDIITSPQRIISMLDGIGSAQQALRDAIWKTVSPNEVQEVLDFVDLATLPGRMESEKCLNIDYKGTISGWVRGSFIETERDSEGKLTQVLYTYQIIDGEKRKELEHFQQLKADYARTEKDNEAAKEAFAKEKVVLEDQNTLLTNENVELQPTVLLP